MKLPLTNGQCAETRSSLKTRALTLVEMMITMGVFGYVILALVYGQILGLRQDELVESKLGASDQARREFRRDPSGHPKRPTVGHRKLFRRHVHPAAQQHNSAGQRDPDPTLGRQQHQHRVSFQPGRHQQQLFADPHPHQHTRRTKREHRRTREHSQPT